jgi:hypothetical protein
MTTATRHAHDTPAAVLLMAFELREKPWKLGCTTGSAPAAGAPSNRPAKRGRTRTGVHYAIPGLPIKSWRFKCNVMRTR